jgi:hypothetical protein
MRSFVRLFGTFVLAATMLALAGAGTVAFAQDDDDLIDDMHAGPGQNEGRVVVRNMQSINVNIDAWVYGNRRNGSGEGRLVSLLKTKADELARMTGLSETQKQKLLLAGEGDVRRFVDRVDEIKLKHQATEFTQVEWQKIFEEIRPLQIELRSGLFRDDSLFGKTLRKALTADQVARYEEAQRDRRLFQYRASVEMTVMQLGNALGLRDDQRKRLVQLMMDQTEPPQTFGQQDQYVVLVQMSGLPEESLKPLFDAGQWRALERQLENSARMLPRLRRNGVLIDKVEIPAKRVRERIKTVDPSRPAVPARQKAAGT